MGVDLAKVDLACATPNIVSRASCIFLYFRWELLPPGIRLARETSANSVMLVNVSVYWI